ncbi:MAG: hypothetical protein N2049_07485 [Anaerolineales bacterium]|nr:hypothetical protein [Anaerolineales bacterium]MCX7609043.1 hypothetical protein [Anaerolineales bacterium]MDW8226618.1 hypothetical protein [Anaerolineales bacterium]
MRARFSIFFGLMGFLALLLSVAAFLARSTDWFLYAFLAFAAFVLAFFLGRGQFRPKPSERFSGVRKLSQRLKQQKAAKKEKK